MDIEQTDAGLRFCSSDERHCYYVDLTMDEAILHLHALAGVLGYTISTVRMVGASDVISATADAQRDAPSAPTA